MDRWERKRRLPHGSLQMIATRLGVTRQTVSDVVRGVRRSYRIERAVSAAIGVPLDKAFPPGTTRSVPR